MKFLTAEIAPIVTRYLTPHETNFNRNCKRFLFCHCRLNFSLDWNKLWVVEERKWFRKKNSVIFPSTKLPALSKWTLIHTNRTEGKYLSHFLCWYTTIVVSSSFEVTYWVETLFVPFILFFQFGRCNCRQWFRCYCCRYTIELRIFNSHSRSK